MLCCVASVASYRSFSRCDRLRWASLQRTYYSSLEPDLRVAFFSLLQMDLDVFFSSSHRNSTTHRHYLNYELFQLSGERPREKWGSCNRIELSQFKFDDDDEALIPVNLSSKMGKLLINLNVIFSSLFKAKNPLNQSHSNTFWRICFHFFWIEPR